MCLSHSPGWGTSPSAQHVPLAQPWLGFVTFGRPDGLLGAGMVPIEGGAWNVSAGLHAYNGCT